tara:strand:- start:3130 stop:3759 length:630 start_codon:yes stop_codon:yes gene_type:complete
MPTSIPVRNPGPAYNYSLKDKLNATNFDVTNALPNGGPVSFPQYDHNHKYSPKNTYLNYSTPGGDGSGIYSDAAAPDSSFGIQGDIVNPTNNVFKNNTSLDITSTGPGTTGGPNRTNSNNIPNGIYTTTIVGTRYGDSTQTGGSLTNTKGQVIKTQIHQYLPVIGQRYLDQNLNPKNPILPSQKPLWKFNLPGGVKDTLKSAYGSFNGI